jgi:hypothetical protein
MASFNFTSAALDEGITFTFGSWVCITDEMVASTATSLKPGSRRQLLQHPAATSTISPKISSEFDFLI